MFCKYCGKEIKNDAQFCPYCGGKQGHEAAEPIARKASPGPGQMTEVIDFGEEQFEEDEYPPYDTVTVVKPRGGRIGKIIAIIVAVLVVIAVAAGVIWFLTGDKDKTDAEKEKTTVTTNNEAQSEAVMKDITKDDRVRDSVLMQTGSYRTVLPDGSSCNLLIENGDHSRFPVRYTEGRSPERRTELALSVLNAEEMGVKTGDTVVVYQKKKDGQTSETTCTVCGIYSDVTNGGKTAKGCLKDPDDSTPVMWSIIYLSLDDEEQAGQWTREYQNRYASSEDGIKITLISDYLKGTYGQTIRNISNASLVSAIMACLILFVVILLLIRLVIWRERTKSSLRKALGFRSSDIQKGYLKKTLVYTAAGMALGIFAGVVPGQALAAMLLRSMGAYGFHFSIDPAAVFAGAPAVTAASVMAAALVGLMEVKDIRAYECLRAGN